ncbi:uncharacterized protein BDV17DRAFT_275905 [Aspergillus undulatus]|uniref:uncharacterized protein n=1 Tax=Aspergillus undulatus TaxID=1810928 RepID=UPI003CCCC140
MPSNPKIKRRHWLLSAGLILEGSEIWNLHSSMNSTLASSLRLHPAQLSSGLFDVVPTLLPPGALALQLNLDLKHRTLCPVTL